MYGKLAKDIKQFLTSKENIYIISFLTLFTLYYKDIMASIGVLTIVYIMLFLMYIMYNAPYIGNITKRFLDIYISFFQFITPDYLYKIWVTSENPNSKEKIITEENYKKLQEKNIIRDKTPPNNLPRQSDSVLILFLIIFLTSIGGLTYLILPITRQLFNNFLPLIISFLFASIITLVWLNITSPIWSNINKKLLN